MNGKQLRNVAIIIDELEKLDTATDPENYCDVYIESPVVLKNEDGRLGVVERIDAGIWSFTRDVA